MACKFSLTLFFALALLAVVSAQKLRLCALEQRKNECKDLERDGPIKCELVQNTAECAIKLAEDRADFGVFTADELLVTNNFYPSGLHVVAELREKGDAGLVQFKYQSVAVVHKNYSFADNKFNLYRGGYCHPGFSRSERWNYRALKYFEKKVVAHDCRNVGSEENEIINIRNYFGKSCRPGDWLIKSDLDTELKRKYPEMCDLCDASDESPKKCEYSDKSYNGHMGALSCLTSGRGSVAYVSLQHTRTYFASRRSNKNQADFQFLCEDGSVMPIDSADPCTWYKQPWNVIAAREVISNEVLGKLSEVSTSSSYADSQQTWIQKLKLMLFRDVSPNLYKNNTTPTHYLSKAKNMELPETNGECERPVRWCTVSDNEQTKCTWTSAVSRSLGLGPKIVCTQAENSFDCFKKITTNETDITSIDSNYGHLARKAYKLSPVMYCSTEERLNSFVVAAIWDKNRMRRIKSWSDVKESNACFPEYAGIAWLSFINTARDQRLVSNSCKYSQIVANFLSGACTPGFAEASHSPDRIKPRLSENHLEKLCQLCPRQTNGEQCEANHLNPYFGDKGALDCLKERKGDIAFLEVGNIKAFIKNNTLNESDYRVLCKNGSLAEYTGFNVDKQCALLVTIDSEVVSRRAKENSEEHLHLIEIQLFLTKLEDWLGYRAGKPHETINIFGPFNGTENLLFKDSIVGLELPSSRMDAVQSYKDLFSHVDACSGSLRIFAVVTLVVMNFAFARFI